MGYDHASGFGLLRPSVPIGVKPMPMGKADDVAQSEPVMVLPAGGRDAASLAYVVSKRKFAASWEYLLDTAIFTSPPTMQWAGAALVSREGKLVGIGSLFVRETRRRRAATGQHVRADRPTQAHSPGPHREGPQERAGATLAGRGDRRKCTGT